MDSLEVRLHKLFNNLKRHKYPFDISEIPKNGIYVVFEKGEKFENMDRIVRIGTHTGDNQLPSRLKQHFIRPNKNRSIFRKNIGRCFLNVENKDYLKIWNLDTTPKKDREKKLELIDSSLEKQLEERISDYIQNNFTFCIFEVKTKEERLFWEEKITSTLSNMAKEGLIKPSKNWLGNQSPLQKISESGLWQIQGLFKESLTEDEFADLEKIVKS